MCIAVWKAVKFNILHATFSSPGAVNYKNGHMSVKKFLYVLTVGACLLTACKKNKSTSVEEELINKVKAENPDCTCDPFIKQYEWLGRIVYVQAYMGPACNTIPSFYNSSGEKTEVPARISFDEFIAQSTFIKDVWSCTASGPHNQ